MRNLITIIIVLSSFVSIYAQNWQTDLETAQKMSKENHQNIILVFSGSDWCAPCMKLENEIWSSDEFKTYSKDHFILLKADFPRRKQNKLSKEQQEKNNQLAETYNLQGYFPLVVVLDSEGKVLGKTGYKKATPKEYIDILSSF
jgi:thioredoxin-related protein